MVAAVEAGCRRHRVCEVLGIDRRTEQRWRAKPGGVDARAGRTAAPPNKLSDEEKRVVLETANSTEFRNLSPKQIVPRLADQGRYIASESTFYRILREHNQLTHRQRCRPPRHKRPKEHIATAPCQVWSWDITYLSAPVRGEFFYLYLIEDIWSRKIVGYEVHQTESMVLSSQLIEQVCADNGVTRQGLVLHADNGGPMRGATMLATMQKLGVVPSFSRPRVSDDNAYCESLFRTLKYRPAYPRQPFESLEAARDWVADFVRWYNMEHLHSGINFVSPQARHSGAEPAILESRRQVYRAAKQRHPQRWTGECRNWQPTGHVSLNPRSSERNQTNRTTVRKPENRTGHG